MKAQRQAADAPVTQAAQVPLETADAETGEGDEGDDWAELKEEERMAKRVKKGKATKEDFEMEFGIE